MKDSNSTQDLKLAPLKIREFSPFFVFSILYVLSTSHNLSTAHDSVNYFNNIIGSTPQFHPHHLLYEWVTHKWFTILSSITENKYVAATSINGLAGAACVQIIFLILRNRLAIPFVIAMLGSSLAGLTFGLWYYSATIEVYVIPTCFLLTSIYILGRPAVTAFQYALIGAMHAIAMLFHQAHVLFFVVVIFSIIRSSQPFYLQYKLLLAYSITATILVALGYTIAIINIGGFESVSKFVSWFLGYSQEKKFWNSPFEIATYLKAAVGAARAVIGGHFVFALEDISTIVGQIFSSNNLIDEAFLVRNIKSHTTYILLFLCFVVVNITFYLLFFRTKSKSKIHTHHGEPGRTTLENIAVWLITYSVFFLLWEPQNPEFWIPQAAMLVILFVSITSQRHSPKLMRWALFILCSLIAVINGIGSILPNKSSANDYFAARIQPIVNSYTPSSTLVIIGDWWPTEYFFKINGFNRVLSASRSFEIKVPLEHAIQEILDESAGIDTVIIFEDIENPLPSTINELGNSYLSYIRQLRLADLAKKNPGIDIISYPDKLKM